MTDIRMAVLGTSWIASAFVAAAATVDGVRIDAVCSRSADTAAGFAQRHAIARIHTDVDALAGDPQVDAVYIATPNAVHARQATTLLAAGKHVLVEKPLAATAADVEALALAAHRAGRLLMEAYVAPFEPNVAAIRDALPRLGPVRRAVFVKDQYSSKYDALKAGGLPNAFNPALAGGSLMDIGFYPVSLAVHLFGEPTSIHATGLILPSGVDGHGTLVLGYGGFDVLCLHSKVAPTGIGSEITGEDAVITFDDCSVPTQVALTPRLGSPDSPTTPGFSRRPGQSEDLTRPQSADHMRYEIAHFVEAIRRGDTVSALHPPARSLAALRILDEARRQVGVRYPSDT
jgi:predicted dehydrogenase